MNKEEFFEMISPEIKKCFIDKRNPKIKISETEEIFVIRITELTSIINREMDRLIETVINKYKGEIAVSFLRKTLTLIFTKDLL